MKRIIQMAVICLAATANAVNETSPNILPNPGLEDAKCDGWYFPNRWKTVDGVGRGGSHGLVYENEVDPKYYAFPTRRMPVTPGLSYRIVAWVRTENLRNADGTDVSGRGATVCAEWYNEKGEWAGGNYPSGVKAKNKDWTRIEIVTPRMPPEIRTMSLSPLIGQGLYGRAYWDDMEIHEVHAPAIALLTTDCYRDTVCDADKSVRMLAGLNGNEFECCRGLADARAGFLLPDGSKVAASFEGEWAVAEVPVSRLPMGAGEVTFAIRARNGKVSRKSFTVTRIAAWPRETVHFDRHRRVIVDGKPFFPLGMYFGDVTEKDMAMFSKGPFNCIMPYGSPSKKGMDICQKYGIKVIYSVKDCWYGHRKDIRDAAAEEAWIRARASFATNHPAMLAWYVNDEFGLEWEPRLSNRRVFMHTLDPNHPCWSVIFQYWSIREYMPTFDAIGTDPYPSPGKDLERPIVWMRETERQTHKTRPIWQVPLASDLGAYERTREKQLAHPVHTKDEFRNMIWQGLAEGANGVVTYSWFDIRRMGFKRNADEAFAEICDLGSEVKRFEQVFLSTEDPVAWSVPSDTDKKLAFRTWKHGGTTYLVGLNAGNTNACATVTLAGKFGAARTLLGQDSFWKKTSPDAVTFSLPHAAVSFIALEPEKAEIVSRDNTKFVNPFIGTLRNGAAHPGATWPFGMVQPGPEVGDETPPPSGYRYDQTTLQGFTQNRIMGTFWGCLHDILLLPFAGEKPSRAKMDKKSERAEPGYYAVRLADSGIACELTCSERVAFHRYSFPKGGAQRVLVDLGAGPLSTWGGKMSKPPRVIASESAIGADGILAGHNVVKCNINDRDVSFALRFSRAWARVTELPPREDASPAKRYVFEFDPKQGESIVVKVSLSTVDQVGAKANLATDAEDFDFDSRRRNAHAAWARLLGAVDAEGSPERLRVLYTMIYQSCVQPQRTDDADGRVRIKKDKVVACEKPFYSGFLDTWDTFRAAHPLYTILVPREAGLFAESLLAYPVNGCGGIPSNAVFGRSSPVMPGNHGVPVVADAFLKGLVPGWSAERVFEMLDKSIPWAENLAAKGWYPLDPKNGCGQHLALQLDEVADAEAICLFAARTGVGSARVAAVHRKRADSWTNVYDAVTGAMRPRNSQGKFVGPEPFDFFRQCLTGDERARHVPWGINEGGYAQWAWHVMGAPERLVALHGGREKAAADLDRIFKTPTNLPGQRRGYGCTGPVGQYFHGNEPTHHMPYYYQFMGRPDRTQEIVREICTRHYRDAKDGMCGDGDSGQMGAWYVMSSFGFYSFMPVGGDYVLGAPQYPRIVLNLANGKRFAIVARNFSDHNLHVRGVTLNGKPIDGFILKHDDIVSGGELVFDMCK